MIPLIKEFETIERVGLEERKRAALEHILEAWSDGNDAGIEPEVMASAAIYAALTDLIETMGIDQVASMMAGLPARIRHGEFTIPRTLQ